MLIGNWTHIQVFDQFINDNEAIYEIHKVPQNKILEEE